MSDIKALIRQRRMTADEIGEIAMSLYVHQVQHGQVSREDFCQVVGEVIETAKTCIL